MRPLGTAAGENCSHLIIGTADLITLVDDEKGRKLYLLIHDPYMTSKKENPHNKHPIQYGSYLNMNFFTADLSTDEFLDFMGRPWPLDLFLSVTSMISADELFGSVG